MGSVTTALIAAGASLTTLLVGGLAVLVARRRRRRSEEHLALAVSDMNMRLEAMVEELTAAVERAQDDSRRSRALAELGGSIDLDEVLSRTLEAAGATPGADAALITIEGFEGSRW